jgi:hypothetical protein
MLNRRVKKGIGHTKFNLLSNKKIKTTHRDKT